MKSEIFRLIKNLIVVTIITIIGYFTYLYFFDNEKDNFKIDETPIHIDQIKTIAEINVVSYKDEIVVDSIELYDSNTDLSYYSPTDLYQMYNRNISRRLTIIVHGEVKYGIDLSDNDYSIQQNDDTVWLSIPSPKVTDIILSPSKMEVFTEKGTWNDEEKNQLMKKAYSQFEQNAKKLQLQKKAIKNVRAIFNRMIITKKKLIINFENEK